MTNDTSKEENPIALPDEEIDDYKVWQWGSGVFATVPGLFLIKRKFFTGGK